MKKLTLHLVFCLFILVVSISNSSAQISPIRSNPLGVKDPWNRTDLMEPAVLAAAIKAKKAPLVFNIGSVDDIKGAVHIGPGNKADNIAKLKNAVSKLPKDTRIVIYCGCCPFAKCPNVRPAFNTLKTAGLKNVKLLNLPDNLNANWTSKGYPLETN